MAGREHAELRAAAWHGGCLVFDFDACAELLRGDAAALAMHDRRCRLALQSLGLARSPMSDEAIIAALQRLPDPYEGDDPPGLGAEGQVSPVYEF